MGNTPPLVSTCTAYIRKLTNSHHYKDLRPSSVASEATEGWFPSQLSSLSTQYDDS